MTIRFTNSELTNLGVPIKEYRNCLNLKCPRRKALRLWLLNQESSLSFKSNAVRQQAVFVPHFGTRIHLHLQIFLLWKTIPGDSQPGGIGVANSSHFKFHFLLGTKSICSRSLTVMAGKKSLDKFEFELIAADGKPLSGTQCQFSCGYAMPKTNEKEKVQRLKVLRDGSCRLLRKWNGHIYTGRSHFSGRPFQETASQEECGLQIRPILNPNFSLNERNLQSVITVASNT
ncbi:hypothetical protein CEXT_553481 [Caerostris extrusa]|uniref:Uncharacterized protein n=1 Tax=Caerostris extrusa TaxID=172846 RepID=A0AAV4MAE0_CAEEX|nr:hypothetical protein CEXT_553481 [Caerostris extrusa]